jgi:DNA-binding NarL/FixJ family response regulator
MKIIIVDDSPFVRRYVRDLLEDHKDLILAGEAKNIEDGLRLVVDVKPDVIILDIVMPGGNGLILLSAVKALRPLCKIIIMSNHAEAPIRKEAKALGADAFLDKAFEFEKLIDTIRS